MDKDLNKERVTHNFLNQITGGNYQISDVETMSKYTEYLMAQEKLPSYKVALLFICLNEPYWQYAENVVAKAKKFFLPGHQTDFFLWSDMPKDKIPGVTVFPTDPIPWPGPTLYRYHLFLQQEELLKTYDKIFYLDIDMDIVNYIGDEVIPQNGITAALHPMYALKKQLWPPYEPNKDSSAYVKRPGKIINDGGQPRFMPMYFAGGFQGGTSESFLNAMKVVSKNIDEDENKRGYKAIWNDESHWNKYLTDNEPEIVLTPSYIYPDSLIEEYYKPIWGCAYPPKIITLTKKFSTKALTPEEQAQIKSMSQLK